MSTTAELADLERELEEVRKDLLISVERELDLRADADVERAESVDFIERSFHQREASGRRHILLVAQLAGQKRESARLHAEFQRLQRAVKLAKGDAPIPAPVVIPAAQAEAMDETMEVA